MSYIYWKKWEKNKKMKFKDFYTNSDGRGSTTAFVQFLGFFILAGALIYAIFLDRASASELYTTFAIYCGGLVATKGAVSAYKTNKEKIGELKQND